MLLSAVCARQEKLSKDYEILLHIQDRIGAIMIRLTSDVALFFPHSRSVFLVCVINSFTRCPHDFTEISVFENTDEGNPL